MQDKFRLDLSDEEAVHYMQSLIDESVGALFAAVVEQIHKFAQVCALKHNTQHTLLFLDLHRFVERPGSYTLRTILSLLNNVVCFL